VYSSDWRKEASDELDEPLPAEACRLAAPLERCEPEPLHLVEEPPQARVVKALKGLYATAEAVPEAAEEENYKQNLSNALREAKLVERACIKAS
jgi:hypothetical protein